MNAIHSSGNLTADKRADYARMLSESGDFQAAADLMRQALELAPEWAAGWFELGKYCEKAAQSLEAASAFHKVLGLSPRDLYGARLKLAQLTGSAVPNEPQTAYVEALFDDYAEKFDTALLDRLGYRVPELLASLIVKHAERTHFGHAIDLGCGTGLMAQAVVSIADTFSGVDLSAAMLAKAKARGLYQHLVKADLIDGMAQLSNADLIVAADVFMYFPGLEPVFQTVSEKTLPGGIFAFSVEKLEGNQPFALQPSLRHAHSERYILSLLEANGLKLLGSETAIIRRDGTQDITGLLCIAQKSGAKAVDG
jgi:predicted TPR repeat methyltransferase